MYNIKVMEDDSGAPQHVRLTYHSRSSVLCQWPRNFHSWIPLLAFKFQFSVFENVHEKHASPSPLLPCQLLPCSHLPDSDLFFFHYCHSICVCVYTCVYKLLSPLSIARIHVCAGQTTRGRAAYVRASSWRTPTLPFSSP